MLLVTGTRGAVRARLASTGCITGYAVLVPMAYQWGRYPNESPLVPAGIQAPTILAFAIFVGVMFALSHRNRAAQERHQAMDRAVMPFLGGAAFSGFGLLGALHAGVAVWLHTDGPSTRFAEIPVMIAVSCAVGSAFLVWLRWDQRHQHQGESHSRSRVSTVADPKPNQPRRINND